MDFAAIFILCLAGGLVFMVPKHFVVFPLLLVTVYLGQCEPVEVGPVHFFATQILISLGLLRLLSSGAQLPGGLNGLDRVMLAWGAWLIGSSIFHSPSGFVARCGLVWIELGTYFLVRLSMRKMEHIERAFRGVCLLLIPVAVAMLFERFTGQNWFASILSSDYEIASFRMGHYRAQGPFIHAIFAGTVGATCLPMALWHWQSNRWLAIAGLAATMMIVFACGSSGPWMALFGICCALAIWKIRWRLRALVWSLLLAAMACHLMMNDSVYFLLARIDITGGSTGWYRAVLIQQTIAHLDEWWIWGADYTRHWMPTGIPANENSSDITNHYVQMGVWGGLPLLVLFILALRSAFAGIGKALKQHEQADSRWQFMIWIIGAILFGHVINFVSIAYYDQSVVFLDFLLGVIGTLGAMEIEQPRPILQEAVQ